MATTFDTTAWLLQTFLILVGMLAAVPVLRAAFGLAIVIGSRAVGRSSGRLHDYGMSLLPKFAKALLTAGIGLGTVASGAHATPPPPRLVLDRVVEFPARTEAPTPAGVGTAQASGPRSPAPQPHGESAASREYRVNPGDSLWSIAKAELSRSERLPSNQEIDAAWRQLWLENLHVVGNDPSLIYPGQRLRIPGDLHAR